MDTIHDVFTVPTLTIHTFFASHGPEGGSSHTHTHHAGERGSVQVRVSVRASAGVGVGVGQSSRFTGHTLNEVFIRMKRMNTRAKRGVHTRMNSWPKEVFIRCSYGVHTALT